MDGKLIRIFRFCQNKKYDSFTYTTGEQLKLQLDHDGHSWKQTKDRRQALTDICRPEFREAGQKSVLGSFTR
jgi:hypothetical protein